MTSKNRPAVKSNATLFSILRSIKDNNLTTVTEIASELGLAKSTVHNHLQSLHSEGFVEQRGSNYHLGLRFLDYGKQIQLANPLYEVSKSKIDELAASTQEKAWCFVEEGGLAVYLYGAFGAHSTTTPARIGTHTNLHLVAGGKAILAHLPESRVRAIIELHGLGKRTENTITDSTGLFEDLAQIRERGFAFNIEEAMKGMNAVAAPVLGVDGQVYGALSIGGPTHRLTTEYMSTELAPELLGIANEVEINLRHR